MSTTRVLLVDTASLYFRAFYALPTSMKSTQGVPINAVHGLLDMLARQISNFEPAGVICAWDNDWRPAWRVDLVPSYKAARVAEEDPPVEIVGAGGVGADSGQAEESPDELAPQVPMILEVLDALGIPVVGKDRYEADDVLASLATQLSAPAVVLTGDRDLFQLAHGDTVVAYVGRGVGRHEVVDSAWVEEHYGIRADQYSDFATMRGDPSDGLPGVRGIGEKTAATLLQGHGDLAGIVAAAADTDSGMAPKIRLAVANNIDYLARAREVTGARTDLELELPPVDFGTPDLERCTDLAEHWRIGGPITRLLEAMGHSVT